MVTRFPNYPRWKEPHRWACGGTPSPSSHGTHQGYSHLLTYWVPFQVSLMKVFHPATLLVGMSTGIITTENSRVQVLVLQSYPTLWDPLDGSPPGSSVLGLSQARTLEWVAISSSRGSSQPKDQTHISYTGWEVSHILFFNVFFRLSPQLFILSETLFFSNRAHCLLSEIHKVGVRQIRKYTADLYLHFIKNHYFLFS